MKKRTKLNCICFVILHYGDPRVTDLCVTSIQNLELSPGRTEQTAEPLHQQSDNGDQDTKRADQIRIIVVDNDARLSEKERLAFALRYQDMPNVTVLHTGEGTGFSEANNLGYRHAREKLGADCIIVCNNDIEFVQKDFVRRLKKSSSEMGCHVLGPNVIRRANGEPQNPMDTRLRTKEEARYTIRMNRLALKLLPAVYPLLAVQQKSQERTRQREKKENLAYYREPHKHIIPFGACLIFLPEFVKREERAFDPETQFYYEEYILADRCFRKGYETGYDPRLKVIHETAAATKESAGSEYRRMKQLLKRTADACEVYLKSNESGE